MFVFVGLAQAADVVEFTPQVTIPGAGSPFQSQQPIVVGDNTKMICDYIVAIYKYAITIVGVLAVLAVAMGGVMWIVAGGNSGTIGEGKQWIISGITGLVLALGSFILLATINKDLVTCKVQDITQIGAKAQPYSGGVYTPNSLKAGKVTKDLDNSGKHKCCVIQGKTYVVGSDIKMCGSNDGDGITTCSKFGALAGLKRCATYQSADKNEAQKECNTFYADYKCHSGFWDEDCQFKERSPLDTTVGDQLWSAVIYDGACWDNPDTKNWCKGQ